MIKYSMKSIDEIRKEIASAFRKMLPNNKETIKIEQPIQITTEKFEPKITESIEFLDNDGKNLRPHQIDALSRIKNESIGQVSIPTGTGKTLIQLHIHLQDMMEKSKNN